jgi:hypothetical protein
VYLLATEAAGRSTAGTGVGARRVLGLLGGTIVVIGRAVTDGRPAEVERTGGTVGSPKFLPN